MTTSDSKLIAVDAYCDSFRELVNDRTGWKENPAQRLRLNSDNDWSFVCVAMDILGDASLALHNFFKFGLDGPTRYDETGEKYLRLYGLLSAAYIQQQAALKLHKLMNCTAQKDFKNQVDKLEIRGLRHQLASHSLDCLDLDDKIISAYVPVRFDLRGFNCTVAENRGDRLVSYDLREAVTAHCIFLLDLLDAIYEKSYKTLFKSETARLTIYQGRLKELRVIKAGALILHRGSPNSPRIVLVAATPNS
ncbi:hypothetical protein [Variovorax sp. PCZ-1]|uniref:hypothetical protein n=1 Tax=Variovorax sp. PCZ-1 TaxID=2835533 RepID=UPI001BCE216B|nr:hypothetical protein [Variovorax sp. PCZ-1]MBS7807499.1 hypothetical protein [Variovorax sp. PCZ-1]